MQGSSAYTDNDILDEYLEEIIQLYFAGCPALTAIEIVRMIIIKEKDLLAKV